MFDGPAPPPPAKENPLPEVPDTLQLAFAQRNARSDRADNLEIDLIRTKAYAAREAAIAKAEIDKRDARIAELEATLQAMTTPPPVAAEDPWTEGDLIAQIAAINRIEPWSLGQPVAKRR